MDNVSQVEQNISPPIQLPQTPTKQPTNLFKNILFTLLGLVIGVIITYILVGKKLLKTQSFKEKPTSIPTQSLTIPTQILVNPLTNWKIYSNKQYGFEFQYPSDWDLNDGLSKGGFLILGPSSSGYSVEININDNKDNSSLKEFLNKFITAAQNQQISPLKFDSREETMINGLAAEKLNNVFAFDHGEERVYLAKDKIVIQIGYPINEANQNFSDPTEPIKYYDVVQRILSSFKFTDSIKSCQYNGKFYNSGEKFPSLDKCNTCSCENGNIACTAMACQ